MQNNEQFEMENANVVAFSKRLFSQTLLLLDRKTADCPCTQLEVQNSLFYVTIGLWILTTNFTKNSL